MTSARTYETLAARLDELGDLADGWYGPGTLAPDVAALENAKRAVMIFYKLDVPVALGATGDGDVVAEWKRGEVAYTATIEHGGQTMSLTADHTGTDEVREGTYPFGYGDLGEFAETGRLPLDVTKSARYLKSMATHFAQSDWNYTRMHDIRHIRMAGDWSGYDRVDKRVRRVARQLFGPRDNLAKMLDIRHRSLQAVLATIRVGMRTEKHLPDGVLDGGSVIAHWEETGEYLQMVQPSVGELLAEFLLDEPDNPHAQAILAELDRIQARYSERVRAGQVDGRVREDGSSN